MNLYEITTGQVGYSYQRAYVWAADSDTARALLSARYPTSEIKVVRYLFTITDGAFCTDLSDEGWEMS